MMRTRGHPAASDEPATQSGVVLRRLASYCSPYRLPLLGVLRLVIAGAVVQALSPALIRWAIDAYLWFVEYSMCRWRQSVANRATPSEATQGWIFGTFACLDPQRE